MPRDHARILLRIWADQEFRDLDEGPQRTYFLLLSEGAINNAGVLPLQMRRWSNCAKSSTVASVASDLEELAARRFVVVDHDTEEVLVRSFIRNDGVAKQPNTLKNAARVARSVQSPQIRAALAVELQRVRPSRPDSSQAHEAVMALDQTVALLQGSPGPSSPSGSPVDNPTGNPSPYPSNEVHSVPQSNDTPNLSANPEGKGRGKGLVVDSPSDNSTCEKSAPRAGGGRRPPMIPDAELNRTAARPDAYALVHHRWRPEHAHPYRPAVYREITKTVDGLLRDHADPELLLAALRDWDHRGRSPAFLIHCYDDAVHASRGPGPPRPAQRVATTDQRVTAALALAAEYATEAPTTTGPFRALPGGAA